MKGHRFNSAAFAAALLLIVSASDLRAAPAASSCNHVIGAREEVLRTPRADTNLELLALALSGGVVADQAIYERLLRDVTAIRSMETRLKSVRYLPPHDGKTMLVHLSETASALFAEGKYDYWDCVNRHYGLESTQMVEPGYVKVRLKGIYDLNAVASVYARLPGVLGAEPYDARSVDHGATILVTRENDEWHYVFRTQSASAFYYFTTHGNQNPKSGGVWTGQASSSPAWLRKYWFGTERR